MEQEWPRSGELGGKPQVWGRSCLHVACTAGAVTIRVAEVICVFPPPVFITVDYFSCFFFFSRGRGGGTGLAMGTALPMDRI